MQYDPRSIKTTYTDAWKNPESLGFSTWQRHTAVSLAAGNADAAPRKYERTSDRSGNQGLGAIYDRHASFASGLIARRHQQNESTTDDGRFVYTSLGNKPQHYSYPPPRSGPAFLQHKPYHGLVASPSTAPGSDPAGGGTISRMRESRSRTFSYVDTPLRSAESVSGHASAGAEPRPFVATDPLPWSENPPDPFGSFTSSSPFRLKGGAGLPVGHDGDPERNPMRNSMCRASLSINRNLAASSSFYSPIRSGEGIHRAHKRASVISEANAEAGPVLNPGLPYAVRNLSSRIQRGLGSPHIHQLPGRQARPLGPLVSEAATIARTATVSEFQYGGYSDSSESISPKTPNTLPGFSPSSRPMSAMRSAARVGADGIDRKEGIRDLRKTESPSQFSSDRHLPTVAAEPSGPDISGFSERLNDRFNDPDTRLTQGTQRTHHTGSPGSISYVLRRFMHGSSSKTSSLKTSPPADGYRAASGDSSLTGRHDSIALTSSAQIPVSAHGIPEGIQDTPDLMLRRSIAALRLPPNRSGGGFRSLQVVATHALPGPVQHPKSMQPRLMPKQGEHPRGYEGRSSYGDHGDYGGYEAGGLPVVQCLQDKTSLFPAHRTAVTPKLAASSVHSPDTQTIDALPHLSQRVLQKKPVGLSTAGPGPSNRPGPGLQLSHVSHGGKSARDGAPPFHGLHPLTARSGVSTPSGSVNDWTNYSGMDIADHGVSADTADTRLNIHSPTFLPLGRQTGITRTAYARSGIIGSRDTGMSIPSAVSGSMAIDSMERGSIDSNSSGSNSPDNDAIHIGPYLLSRIPSISLRKSPSIRSISTERIIPASEARWRDNGSFSADQSISPAPSSWAPSSDERPLAVLQRAQNKLMRVSTQGNLARATPGRPEDRYGLVSPPSEPMPTAHTPAGDGNKVPESGPGQTDPEETAEHVWQIMAERLVIEQERRGLAKWP